VRAKIGKETRLLSAIAIVNQDGIVYQKDLGHDTSKIASAIQAYDPDKTWIPAN
jgi:Protein of unknown function (DUF2950)